MQQLHKFKDQESKDPPRVILYIGISRHVIGIFNLWLFNSECLKRVGH